MYLDIDLDVMDVISWLAIDSFWNHFSTEIQKVMAEKRKEAVAEDEKRNDELFKQMSESFKKAEDSYYKAMDELPGGFKLIGMQVRQY